MYGARNDPGVVAVFVDVKAAAPRREVCKHDSDIHRAGENTGTKSSDGFGSDLGQVDGGNNSGLAYSQPHDEPACVYLPQSAIVGQENLRDSVSLYLS